MVLKHWLVCLQQHFRFQSRSSRRKDSHNRRLLNRTVPAQTEVLEDRTMLTAYVVTTLDDVVAADTFVSLREAIQAANTNTPVNEAAAGMTDGDSITFDPSIAGGTIVLTLGQLEILDDLTIDGADPGLTEANITVSGNNVFRIFSINTSTGVGSNTDVSFSNLNLDAGNTIGSIGDDGGAIFIADGENVTLDTLSITNSTADGNGGAIFAGDGTLNITNSQIGNEAADNDFWSNSGATATDDEIFVFVDVATGTPTLDVLNDSGASLSSPLNPVAAGVDVDESGNVFYNVSSPGEELLDYDIYSSVVDTTAAVAEAEANGTSATANTIAEDTLNTGALATMADVDFFEITLGATDDRLVAIVDNDPEDDTTATMTQVDIIDSNGTTVLASGLFAGGVANAAIATGLTGGATYFVRITSSGGGTGTYSFVAKALGTANQVTESEPNNTRDAADTLLLAQFGQGDIVVGGANQAINGGGIFVDGGTLNLDFTSVNNNVAIGAGADQGGGGIYSLGGTVSITNSSTVNFNSATGTSGSGGGILANGGTLTIADTAVNNNTAARAGGGLETRSTVTSVNATITDSSISNNIVGSNPGNGGGIHVTSTTNTTTVTITGGNISNNSAAAEGGGFWNDVTGTMTITGVNIDGNTASGALADQGGGGVFNNGGTVIINSNGLTATSISGNIANGALGSGGGILNDGGTLTITGATITGNSAVRAGGGIEVTTVNARNSTATLSNVTISNNDVGSSPGNGGGVHISDAAGGNTSTFTVNGGSVTGNSAAAEGGGLWNDIGGTLTLNGVTVTGNTASGNSADQGGGGVFNNGGIVSITGGSISTNIANGTAGSGGGILNDGGTLTITATTINGNSAVRAGGGIEATTANARDSVITVSNAFITNNDVGSSPGNGGGVHISDAAGGNTSTFSITGGFVMGNSAASEGGGLWNDIGGTMNINGTLISSNTASGAALDQGGGGIFNNGGTVNITSTLGPTIILSNVANGAAGSGGGILNDGGTLNITGALIIANSAVRAGGGIEATTVNARDSVATLTNVTIAGNLVGNSPGNGGGVHVSDASGGNTSSFTLTGGSVTGNIAAAEGGGLWNDVGGTMTINGATITGNIARGNSADQGGGGVFNNGGTVVIQNNMTTATTISGNFATGTAGSGGGILNDGGTLTITGATITGNSAVRAGGGIEATTANARNSIITMTNSTLSNNLVGSSPGNGGGVHITDLAGGNSSTFSITGSMVTGNSAASEGGGLWNDIGGSMMITETIISGNTASGASATNGGGGVFNNGGSTLINESMILNNIANGSLGSGGGVFNDAGGTLTIVGTSITANTANRAGGGIEDNAGTFTTLADVSLIDNVAQGGGVTGSPGNGGGLHITGAGTVQIIGGTVGGNSAASEGGGLWNSSTGTLLVGSETSTLDDPFIDEATGANAAAIQATVDNFRNNLGTLNGNNPGSLNGGRREINWDGVPDGSASPNAFPGDFFNQPTAGRARGVEFTTVGTGFQVSANAASAQGIDFSNINANYEDDFEAFSAERLFTPIGSNVTVINFFVPGTDTPATVTGFGAVFSDVDSATSTLMEFFDKDGNLIASRNVMATAGDQTFSFTGVSFTEAVIAQVRITTGTNPFGATTEDGGAIDLVVMDDFIFGEPVAIGTANTVISGNTASGASASNGGGGIFNDGGILSVVEATISGNTANGNGGGIFNEAGGLVDISRTTISGNIASGSAGSEGGGILNLGSITINDSTLSGNTASGEGGGVWNSGTLVASQITLSGNTAGPAGGGVFVSTGGSVDIRNSTITLNGALGESPVLGVGGGLANDGGTVYLESTIIAENFVIGGLPAVITPSDVDGAVLGTSQFNLIGINTGLTGITNGTNNNMIGTVGNRIDPLLGALADNGGPTLTHALLAGSPATNAGSNPDDLEFDQRGEGFPRVIGGQIDIGALETQISLTVVGGGPGEDNVNVYNALTGDLLATITPYPGFFGGIRTAVGDVNGDGVLDVITAAGPGAGPHVKVFSGADNFVTELFSFFAFNPNFTSGMFVAAANFNPGEDDNADIVVGADAGGGSHVIVFNGTDLSVRQSFFAYGTTFGGGVRVGTGDITGDDIPDIITGAGAGAGPHVRVFDGSLMQMTLTPVDIGGPLGSFFAFPSNFAGGVFVAGGDVNGDGRDDVIAGAGAGGGPAVKAFSGLTGAELVSFFAFPSTFGGGVTVGTTQGPDGDGIEDIIVGAGPGGGPAVKIISVASGTPVELASFFAFAPTFSGGVFVSGAAVGADGGSLLFGGGEIAGDASPLSQDQLDSLVGAALARLEAAGASSAQIESLSTLDIRVGNLADGVLGRSLPGSIVIDSDASGAGWFIDASPADDVEFDADLNATEAAALGRVDLLTVLLHELGHQLGGGDLDILSNPENLMAESLTTGKRRLPNDDLDALFANGELLGSVLS